MQQQEFTSIEDFVFNPGFRDWILNNNSIHREFWENWLKENPAKASVLNYAKGIVYALSVNHKQLSEEDIDKEIKSILSKAKNLEYDDRKTLDQPRIQKPVRVMRWGLALAAASVIAAIFSISYFKTEKNTKNLQAHFDESVASTTFSSSMEQVNNSDSIQRVTLFDGTTVQLYPKSKLDFSHDSLSKKREVFLTGEAFFDVVKNTSLPFYVYTQNLVTKVLGTSFKVKAYSSDNNATVLVKTGKVSVYKK